MTVPTLSIVFIILNMALGVIVPLGLCIYLRKKFKANLKAFFVGAVVMFFFALVLEQLLHMAVLSSPIGAAMQSNIWLYALYGGLAAGLFEETGRLVGMKFLLKNEHGYDSTCLMYGAGHGGFEMCWLLVMGMVNNLVYSLMLNGGGAAELLGQLDPTNQAVMVQAFETLANTPSAMFLAAPVERLAALTAQLALSVLVWFAVKGNIKLYPLAMLLHALLNIVGVVVNSFGAPIFVTEALIWLMALSYAFLAKYIWNKQGSVYTKIHKNTKLYKM